MSKFKVGDKVRIERNSCEYCWTVSDEDYWPLRDVPALTKPSIDWAHVADKWVAMATDENGDVWLYDETHEAISGTWCGSGSMCKPESHASFTPGTCGWRDSLVLRPE